MELRELIQNFSGLYLTVAKERIDIPSTSHLLFAWTEADCYEPAVGE